ncbi:uncharacterized protein LAESUDRAFT_776592 [Laetiporus sulphureus 93-53]|uniref:DUF6589 domain-containing protein n=1 Tax=Laetiporus sulphureus 93-53 TaxID=1314785 RepID=A0A165HRZ3_9APHY|nr:uncharacterized protein LAESUDRAFT_776592 [Laetiporus sulphureus 93-53]KZT12105.1 hypothetical protein LAESUDRAFT_776592 [Laetiporus sulphureus 93-53]
MRYAIRLNILVNPTGKPDAFRGIDWVLEYDNLLTKDKHGGEGPNYTRDHIIAESPNILVYQSCTRNAECNYHLNGLTSAHGSKNIVKPLRALQAYMQVHHTNKICAGRATCFDIRDMIDRGIKLLLSTSINEDTATHSADREIDQELRAEDLSVEDAI